MTDLLPSGYLMIVFISSKNVTIDVIFVDPDAICTKKKFTRFWLGMRRKAKRITSNKQRVNRW